MERLLTRLKCLLPLFSLQSLLILGVGRLHLRAPLRDPRDPFYRTQREELKKNLNSYHLHREGTIPIDCIILGTSNKIYYMSTIAYLLETEIIGSLRPETPVNSSASGLGIDVILVEIMCTPAYRWHPVFRLLAWNHGLRV